jgi:branched-chain amino acid transport system substrate-binding protein
VFQLNRRQVLRLLGAAGAAGVAAPALAACGDSNKPAPVTTSQIRVGLIVPQAAGDKDVGNELTFGFQLYLNLHGNRLGGHPVQLSFAEEGANADSGRAAVDKLIKQQGVQAMSGVVSPDVMTGIRDQVEAAQVPLLGSNGSPTTLGSVKYIWRTSYVAGEAGRSLGAYVAGYLKNTGGRLSVISDDSSAAVDEVNAFVTTFSGVRSHAELTAEPVIVRAGAPLTPYFNAIRAANTRAVFGYFTGAAAVSFVQAFRAANLNQVALFAPGFLTEGTALRNEGESAAGVYTSLNYSPSLNNGANRTFVAEYQKAYNGPPSTYAMASYDAASVLDKAVHMAGADLSPQSINAALGQVGQIDSPRGSWQFNQSRTPLQQWYLRQVRNDGNVLSNMVLSDLATLT